MKIHEYQAKNLFREVGIPVPQGEMIERAEQAEAVAAEIGFPCVVKAQVHAGGRGKAGGIRLAQNREELAAHVSDILGMRLVSGQSGGEGKLVRKVLIEQGLDIQNEYYLAVLMDRVKAAPVIIASDQGGMEIEKVAAENPGAIYRQIIHPLIGLMPCHVRNLAFRMGFNKEQRNDFSHILNNLFRLFMEKDASLVEINPLVATSKDHLLALDAKMSFDENALCRHPQLSKLRDIEEEEPLEWEAAKYDLSYIKLDGSIGCMVNGAGLAMATMDIIKFYGGEPANFLDIGGATSVDKVREAFRILLSDSGVRCVLVNIFGGIVRTDLVATGIVNAVKGLELKVPVVIRLIGTNQEEGRRIIQESGLNLYTENDLVGAVTRSVKLAAQGVS